MLCIHGFTGSPAEMRPLGQHLAAQGYRADGPLLPKHGGMPHDLQGVRWRDWVEAADAALEQLAAQCQRVFVAGLSMGGLLALHLAACECHRAPNEGRRRRIDGIVVMAAPAALTDRRARLVGVARHVMPYYYPLKDMNLDDAGVRAQLQARIRENGGGEVDFDDPKQRKAVIKSVRIPLGAIHELLQLNNAIMRELPRVTVPALFIQGRKDRTVAADSADVLAARTGAADKRVIWYEDSGHELPLEPDAPAMFEEIAGFIRAHAQLRAPAHERADAAALKV